ncbi:MAG: helix-turn-helix transcriptional regulator [Lachnospiraceae bacterium]|nr:helix-turn-helix transcriptional regulator [Lachnospiraceae bacterium]
MINDLPKKLKELRLKYRLTQKEVALQLDISPSIVSSYETGERTPSTEVLLALSYLYKCSTDYLLGKETIDTAAMLDVSGLTPNQIHALIELINSMKP